MIVGLEGMKGADAASLILARLFQVSGEFAKSGAVIDRTEGVPIALVGFLGNLAPAVHIGYTTPHDAPLQVILRAALCGPESFENLYVLGESLDAKQIAQRGAGFAVTLQRIAVHAVFDPGFRWHGF